MTETKSIPTDPIDALLSGYQKPEDLLGANGLLKRLTKALVERALEAEMTESKLMAPRNRRKKLTYASATSQQALLQGVVVDP